VTWNPWAPMRNPWTLKQTLLRLACDVVRVLVRTLKGRTR
jgi:hypothetical protein